MRKKTESDEKLVIVPSKAIHIDIFHSLLDVDVEKSIVKLVYGDGRVKYYFFLRVVINPATFRSSISQCIVGAMEKLIHYWK